MDLALLKRYFQIIPSARVFAIPDRRNDVRTQLSNRYILQFLRNLLVDSYLEQTRSITKIKNILVTFRTSLRNVGTRIHGKAKDQQAQMQTYQLFLREMSEDYRKTKERLQSANEEIMRLENDELELLIPDGVATKRHEFSLRHSISSGHLEFDLTTKFPIRHVTRTTTPTNKSAIWIPTTPELGGFRFQGKLKNSRTNDVIAEVNLFGWKKEIHADLIHRDHQIVQAQTALLAQIADSISKTEMEWTKASSEYSFYMEEMARYESDFKGLDKPHLGTWTLADMQKVLAARSLPGISTLYGLESSVLKSHFPETCRACETSEALFAALGSALGDAIKYLQASQDALTGQFWVARLALESMQAELGRIFRPTATAAAGDDDDDDETDVKDAFDMAVDVYEQRSQGSDEVAQEAVEVLRRLGSEYGTFEEKHHKVFELFDGVDVEAQEEAVTFVSDIRKEPLVAMEACKATTNLLDSERLPIGVFGCLEQGQSPVTTYISVYEGMKVLIAEGKRSVIV